MRASGGDGVIDFQQLGKRYGNFEAVKGLDFSVARGELFG